MKTDQIKNSFNSFSKKAKSLLGDKNKTLSKIQEGFQKATENEGSLSHIWEKVQLLFSLARDYANGTYNDVSRGSIVAIIASLLYFLSPIDVIPDFILGIGLLDDAFVLGYVYKRVAKEIDKYQEWKSMIKV